MAESTHPDPILTANIYCDNRLDPLIHQAVVPFWQEFTLQQDHHSYLWFVRYARNGEHLKVRIHGPESLRPSMKRQLAQKVETYLASLGEPEEGVKRRSRKDAPPIDVEDRVTEDYPDRTLLWTQYGRSHVSLGGKPFLEDDVYASLFTTCLGRGCEIVMATLMPDGEGRFSHKTRQGTLLKMLIQGIAALGFPARDRAAYFAYHRDWLLRFSTHKSATGAEQVEKLLDLFERQREKMGKAALEPLYRTAQRQWSGAGNEHPGDADAAWRSSLADLLRYIRPLCSDPDFRLDPYASDPVFSPVFKVFHGIANQLGLDMLDEAFSHHLLLHSSTPEPEEASHRLVDVAHGEESRST